jgi:hypothetical protein
MSDAPEDEEGRMDDGEDYEEEEDDGADDSA